MSYEIITLRCSPDLKRVVDEKADTLHVSASAFIRVVLSRLTGQPIQPQDLRANTAIQEYVEAELGGQPGP